MQDFLAGKDVNQDNIDAVRLNWQINEEIKWESPSGRASAITDAVERRMTWEEWQRFRAQHVNPEQVIALANQFLRHPADVVIYKESGTPDIPKVDLPDMPKTEQYAEGHSAFYNRVVGMPVKPLTMQPVLEGEDYTVSDNTIATWYYSSIPQRTAVSLSIWWQYARLDDSLLCDALSLWDENGTHELTKFEFEQQLYRMGARLKYSCGNEWVSISITAPEEKLEAVLHIVGDRLQHPAVTQDYIQGYASDARIGRASWNTLDNRDTLSSNKVRLGRNSQYLLDLSNKEIAALTPVNVELSLRELLKHKPDVYFAGTLSRETLDSWLHKSGILTSRPVHVSHPVQQILENPAVYFFPTPNASQAVLRYYVHGGEFNPQEHAKYSVLYEYLGTSSGLLFSEIREARGLAYSAYGGVEAGDEQGDPNLVWGYVQLHRDNVVKAFPVLNVIMKGGGMGDPKRWALAKNSAIQSIQNRQILAKDVPYTVARWFRQGYTGDPRTGLIAQIEALTPAEMEAYAKGLMSQQGTILIVGDPSILPVLPTGTIVLTDSDVHRWYEGEQQQ